MPKKKMLVDGVSRRMIDFASHFKTVLFVPQDMDLIIATPSKRREFLDTVLSQTDREYIARYCLMKRHSEVEINFCNIFASLGEIEQRSIFGIS